MHVDRGSTINLTCVAKFSPAPPPDVEWYHNGEVSEHEKKRGTKKPFKPYLCLMPLAPGADKVPTRADTETEQWRGGGIKKK